MDRIEATRGLIKLSKSCIGDKEKRAVMGVLDREYLGMGEEVRMFELALTEYFGRQSVCVVNGTAALHLAVQACGIGPGDEVLIPSLTYVSSFQAVSATGARPIACDIDESSYSLNCRDAEARLSKNTRAVMPVHYTGAIGDLVGIYEFAKQNGLRVIEDAAHAFGTTLSGNRIGSFGDIACFSFDGIKNFTSGEGGCLVTDDQDILDRVRDARLLGVERDTQKRYAGQRSWDYDVSAQGWRYHMSNLMAAIGLEQMSRSEELFNVRRQLGRLYDELLRGNPHVVTLGSDYDSVVPHIFVIRIPGLKNRKALQARLLERGIETGIHYQPNHMLSFFMDADAAPLPVTESVCPEIITLPLHTDLSEDDLYFICDHLDQLLPI